MCRLQLKVGEQFPSEAPRKNQKLKVQLCIDDDDDVVGHKLPGKSKKKKNKHPHNLMKSVNEGRAAEKKH